MPDLRRQFGSLVLLSGLATVVGFATQMVVAYHFGTSLVLDSYWLALAVATAMSFYVHPLRESLVQSVFRATRQADGRDSEALSAGIVALLGAACAMALILYGGAKGLAGVGLIEHRPGFSNLLLAFIPFLFLFALSETVNAVMLSLDLALPQAWARLVAAIATLACIALLGGAIGVLAMLASLLVGQMIVLLVSARTLHRNGLRWRFKGFGPLRDRAFLSMFGSLLANFVLAQTYVFTERWTMGTLEIGALSAFLYATLLANVAISLLALPLSNLLWPRFLELEHSGERARMPAMAWQASAPVMFVLLALAAFVWQAAPAVVSVLFERGQFDAVSHEKTVAAVRMTIFATVPIGMVTIALRALMSQGRSGQVAIVGIVMASVGLTVLVAALLTRSLALAQAHWAISNSVGTLLAWIWLVRTDPSPSALALRMAYSIALSLLAIGIPLVALPDIDFGDSLLPLLGSLAVEAMLYSAMTGAIAFAVRLVTAGDLTAELIRR